MRELILIPAESTKTSLVFHAADSDEQFFLAVNSAVHEAIQDLNPQEDAPSADVASPEALASVPDATTTDERVIASAEDSPTADSEPEKAKEEVLASAPLPSLNVVSETNKERAPREVDPRLSTPLKMRPREIQERIRAGASIAELAEENNVTESRIEPFAHPVLLERARVAELAKKSHPIREDGPAKLTLWEILATAFAARSLDLSTSQWDAYRDPAGKWIISVTWKAGLSENKAEWTFTMESSGNATTDALDGMAADLIDPEFAQPVRTITPVRTKGRGRRQGFDTIIGGLAEVPADNDEGESGLQRTRDDIPVIGDGPKKTSKHLTEKDPRSAEHNEPTVTEVSGDEPENRSGQDDSADKNAAKRRRKAVTPHWEDVLLGVRANTKRPRK